MHWNMNTLLIKDLIVRQELITGSELEMPDMILMGCSAQQTRVRLLFLAVKPRTTRRLPLIFPDFTLQVATLVPGLLSSTFSR